MSSTELNLNWRYSCEFKVFSKYIIENCKYELTFNTHILPGSVYWKGLGRSNTPIAMSISRTQTLASKYNHPLKGTGGPWRNTWFQGWGRESTRWDWNILLCQKAKKCSKNDGDMSKGYRRQLKKAPTANLGNVSIKINNDINRLLTHQINRKLWAHIDINE